MKREKTIETRTPEAGVKLDLQKTASYGLIALSALLFIYDTFILLPDAHPTAFERLKTIGLFAAMTYGFGCTLMGFVRKPEDALERLFMTIGAGLALLPILTLILNTLHIPLDATLFLALSLAYPAYSLLVKKDNLDFSAIKVALMDEKSLKTLVAVLLAAIYLHVLLTGALSTPYLEDDDSWDHAVGAKYISVVEDYSLPPGVPVTHYLEPYPPVYDGLMGMLHQYNSSVQWTLKYFNALLIGLSIVMAYYFLRLFTGDERIALGGSFLLTAIPCYLSHFIWAHTLGHVLFYPALYAVEMSNRDRRWSVIAALAIASVLVSQPMVTIVFGLIYSLYYAARALFERKLMARLLAIGLAGVVLAVAFFWGQMAVKYGTGFEKIDGAGNHIKSGEFKIAFEKRTIPLDEIMLYSSFEGSQPAGCATLIPGRYCIPLQGNIAIQKGFGVFVFILFIASIIMLLARYRTETKDNRYWIPVSLAWSAFTFIGLESWALPVSIDPPRFLMFMTLPIMAIVPKGVLMLTELLRKHVKPEHLILLLTAAVLYTSAYPKYVVQTAGWPYGVMWLNPEHIQGYVNLKVNTPPDAGVFPMCMPDSAVIGMDKTSYPWDREVIDFREKAIERTPSELHAFLKNKGYEYVMLDVSCIAACMKKGGSEDECVKTINTAAEGMAKNGGFIPQNWSTRGVVAYKVV
jgi:hypothetical protein